MKWLFLAYWEVRARFDELFERFEILFVRFSILHLRRMFKQDLNKTQTTHEL
jgi:hypothetical protein